MPQLGSSLQLAGMLLIRFEPTVWLVEGEISGLAEILGSDGSLTAIGGGLVRVHLAGAGWRSLLMEGGVFDAETAAFAAGSSAATLIDHVNVRLYVKSDDSCLVYVPLSYAADLLHFWRVAVRMVEANPFGVGLRQYDSAYDDYDDSGGLFGPKRSVHNSHLQVLSELGYAGFVVWVATFGYALTVGLRIRFAATTLAGLTDEERRFYVSMATALLASMCAFIVGGTFIAAANNELTWLTFAGLAALQREFRVRTAALAPTRATAMRPAPVMPVPRRKAIA